MAKSTSRNGKIDLLRFFFSVCIALNHAKYILPKGLKGTFSGFSFSVEFFFLVSGILLMASIEKAERTSNLSLGKETGIFMLRKYKSVYPDVAVAYVLRAVIMCVYSSKEFFPLLEKSWFDAFLLNSTALRGQQVMSVTWYVSSMLICMMILYPFIRKHKDTAINIVLPLGILLLFGFMYHSYGTVRGPMSWTGFTYRGNLRALAELSLGCLCYGLSKKLKNVDFNNLGRTLLALVEFGCYGIFVLYMFSGSNGLKDFLYLFILCIAVIISFSEKSIGHSLFNNRLFTFLGKFSLPFYLIHSALSKRLFDIIPAAESMGAKPRLLIYLALSIAAGLVVMILSKLIRKIGSVLIPTVKRLIIKPAAEEQETA